LPYRNKINLTHNGETHSLRAWAAIIGVPYATLRWRLVSGWSICRALSPLHHAETLTYKGKTRTLARWAAITGIPYNTLRSRIVNLWPAKRALTQPVRYRSPNKARPGVATDFPAREGTAAPRHAQDLTELEISE